MPCDSSYLEPTEREKELQRTAKLLVYVHKELKMPVPQHVRMASSECYPRDESLVPLLCDILKSLSEDALDHLVYSDAKNPRKRDLASWWERHQAADKRRERAERYAAEQAELRKSAVSKLTPSELKALKGEE